MTTAAKKKRQTLRERRWDAAHRVAYSLGATVVHDTSNQRAKYRWLQLVAASSLPPISRLVAHTLCLHGRANGANIYPSTATIAKESGLSERAVCDHIDQLVRGAYLWRGQRKIGREWAGTIYTLCAPKAVLSGVTEWEAPWEADPKWQPESDERGAEPRSVPTAPNGTEPRSAPSAGANQSPNAQGTEPDASGTEPDAVGTERHAEMVLSHVQSSLTSSVLHTVSQGERALTSTALSGRRSERKTKTKTGGLKSIADVLSTEEIEAGRQATLARLRQKMGAS